MLEDDKGKRGDLRTKQSLVQPLVAKPSSEWGEDDSAERRAVDRSLNEWIGRRYKYHKVTVNILDSVLYVVRLDAVDEPVKKRRTT